MTNVDMQIGSIYSNKKKDKKNTLGQARGAINSPSVFHRLQNKKEFIKTVGEYLGGYYHAGSVPIVLKNEA